jgi:hypothetical protein
MDRFSRESLAEWKDSALTKLFLAYLKDRQSDLAQQWARGESLGSDTQAKAALLGEMANPEWEGYADFYGLEASE